MSRAAGVILAAAFSLLLSLAFSCKAYTKMRSVKTVASMQTVAAKIEQAHMRAGKINSHDLEAAVRAVNRGRDAWGTPLVYRLMPNNDYILVSAGPNRRLDVNDVNEYVKRTPLDSRWRTVDDIVFRNGQQITKAGK